MSGCASTSRCSSVVPDLEHPTIKTQGLWSRTSLVFPGVSLEVPELCFITYTARLPGELRIRRRGAGPLVQWVRLATDPVCDNFRPLPVSQKDSFELKHYLYFLYDRSYLVRPLGIKTPDRFHTLLQKG